MAAGGKKQSMEGKIDKMLQMFCSMEERFKSLESRLEGFFTEIQSLKSESQQQGQKVQLIEKEIKEIVRKSDENTRQQNFRFANLEDRQRRRNLRFRGFKRSFGEGKKLFEAFKQWLETFEIYLEESEIERIHWSFARRDPQTQRDVVIAFASERKAENVYKLLRFQSILKCDGTEIRILRDLSRQTLSERAALRPIASLLFQNGVKFSWGFPTAILVFKEQQLYRAQSLGEGKKMLQSLGIQVGAEDDLSKIPAKFIVEATTSDSSGRDTPEDSSLQTPSDVDKEELAKLEDQVAALRKKPRQQRVKRQ